MITFCPYCNQKYEIDDDFLNQEVACTTCQKTFTVKEDTQGEISENSSNSINKQKIVMVLLIIIAMFATILLVLLLKQNIEQGKLEQKNALLVRENHNLRQEITEIKYGPEKMMAEAMAAFENSEIDKAKKIFDNLFQRHPAKKIEEKYKTEYNRICSAINARDKRIAEGKARLEAKLLTNISKKYDHMQSITWYETKRDCEYAISKKYYGYSNKSFPSKSYSIEPYFGKSDNGNFILRLRTRYYNDEDSRTWVFYEKVQLKGSNGVNIFIPTEYPEKKSESGDGSLNEWSDNNVNDLENDFIRLADSEKIFVKFYGKYSYEFEMNPEQLNTFKEIITMYKKMKNM